ncbi:hypothetical protein PsorP6_013635 [Peronosclerospora sorghi]|uniref:Uncharacterized protein n=1 Tax=Peronosclerospora sorghi TaxID=230839 RepID=A0ACC0VJM5_9STRA|nr:hypothetical protein PsorP6_013635 [Peronosclerospora sorghi]
MVNFLELLFLAVLLRVPCAIILLKSAVNPSLFVLHPVLNAIAFLLCFPLGIYLMQARKGLADTFGGKKTTWQWKNSGHRIGGILAFSSGDISQLGENLQFMVACSVSAAYSLLIAKTDGETSHHPIHQERLKDFVYGFVQLCHHAGIVFKEYFGSGYRH